MVGRKWVLMDDRIAEIREALPIAERTVGPVNDAIVTVIDAARAYADLLDSDALIIRRDQINYEAAARDWVGDTPPSTYPGGQAGWDKLIATCIEVTIKPLVDAALASSQGVEPPKEYGSDFISRCHICGRDAGHAFNCSVG